jgi:hypothetical protein
VRSRALATRLLAASLFVASSSALGGCRGKRTRPPYSLNAGPESHELLSAARPTLDGIRVSSAKIRLNRSIAGNLMLLAQRPERFNGQIQISGKELVSLAFHEDGYSLRYTSGDGLPPGFYSGPPSPCAIEELLGVSMAPSELIALVLGGAPLLPDPIEIVDQRWDRKTAHEVLTLRSGDLEEELRFAWHNGEWWPAGATLSRRIDARTTIWLWSALHEAPHTVDGHTLPSKTIITRPDGRRKQKVTITYRSQEPNPEFMRASDAVVDNGGWEEEGGWEDEDDWETEESGASGETGTAGDGDDAWESDDATDTAVEPAAETSAAAPEGAGPPDAGSSSAGEGAAEAPTPSPPAKPKPAKPKPAKPKPAEPVKPVIPAYFILSSDGLPVRGDLCRRR